jgi:ABC-type multidrug transport system permease subunit
MATPGDAAIPSGGLVKFLRDFWAVLEIKLLSVWRGWYWYLITTLIIPASIFYWSRALSPDDPTAIRRVMVGTIIFGVSLNTVNVLAVMMIQDRFQGRLKLFITMPMSKAAYAMGVLAFAAIQAVLTIVVLLGFALGAGVDFSPTWAFAPIAVAALLTMAGFTFFIASYAPSAEIGGVIINLFSIVLVMVSPVFFPIERAPLLLQWLGRVSPFTYTAEGMTKSLSGQADVWVELAALAGFTFVSMTLGLWRLRWREA